MKKNHVIFIVVIAIIVLLGILGIVHYERNKTKIITKTITKTKVVTVTKRILISNISSDKLASWIYNNSYRCSEKQAQIIANILMQSNQPLLFAAIIKNESSFNITAYSSAGAIGLMQVVPTDGHLKQLLDARIINTPRDLFNPTTNIKAGVFIFNNILKLNNNSITKALNMYCGGSRAYVNNVLATFGELSLQVQNNQEGGYM